MEQYQFFIHGEVVHKEDKGVHIQVAMEQEVLVCGDSRMGDKSGGGLNAYIWRGNTGHSEKYAGGGAGNPEGLGKSATGTTILQGSTWTNGNGQNGAGGLLIMYANSFLNNSNITSNGSNGGSTPKGDHLTGGGASGGGSINIFYRNLLKAGTITANGGTGGDSNYVGGNGGKGSINMTKVVN